MDPNKSTTYLRQMNEEFSCYREDLEVDTPRNNGPFSYDHTYNAYGIKGYYLKRLPAYDKKGCYQRSEKLTR
jgi:hypothetical protein